MSGTQENQMLEFAQSATVHTGTLSGLKKCFRCQKNLPRDQFYLNYRTRSGLTTYCKCCNKKANKEYMISHVKEVSARKRIWNISNPDKVYECHKRWKKKYPDYMSPNHAATVKVWQDANPEKCEAQRKLKYAVKKGKLRRLPCEICGSGKSHAHHEDYSKPLEVRWLCAFHHYWEVKGRG